MVSIGISGLCRFFAIHARLWPRRCISRCDPRLSWMRRSTWMLWHSLLCGCRLHGHGSSCTLILWIQAQCGLVRTCCIGLPSHGGPCVSFSRVSSGPLGIRTLRSLCVFRGQRGHAHLQVGQAQVGVDRSFVSSAASTDGACVQGLVVLVHGVFEPSLLVQLVPFRLELHRHVVRRHDDAPT